MLCWEISEKEPRRSNHWWNLILVYLSTALCVSVGAVDEREDIICQNYFDFQIVFSS